MLLDLIAIAFWPVVVGLALTGWLRRTDLDVLAVTWSAASIAIIAGVFYVTIFDTTSLVVLHDFFIGMILFGALCVLTVYGCHTRLTRLQCIGLGLFGVALIGYSSEALLGDHMRERRIVDGVVRQLRVHETARGPNDYLVSIGDETFNATTRTFATLRQGERVRATIGRGSGYIYGVEKL